jgi:hypothetical protein
MTQNIAMVAGLLLVGLLLLRRVPVIGLAIRLVMHTALLASPLVIVAVLGTLVWFQFSSLLSGSSDPTPREAASATLVVPASPERSPGAVPLPPRRPRNFPHD